MATILVERINYLFNEMTINRDKIKSLRWKAMAQLGDKCVWCGFLDKRVLQFDHVNGNGAEERQQFGKAHNLVMFTRILEGSADYQLLCANCNVIKARTQHENVGHKRKKRNL